MLRTRGCSATTRGLVVRDQAEDGTGEDILLKAKCFTRAGDDFAGGQLVGAVAKRAAFY